MRVYVLIAAGVRLFAIYMLIQALTNASYLISFDASMGEAAGYMTYSILSVTLPFLVSILLWIFPFTIARKLAPGLHKPELTVDINATVAFRIGSTLLGLWLFAGTISEITNWTFMMLNFDNYYGVGANTNWSFWSGMIATTVKLIFALVLMFGSGSLSRLFGWLREFGLSGKISEQG